MAIKNLVQESLEFNTIAGKGANFSKDAIHNQIRLINEETQELNDAFAQNDPVELLDAVIDIYIVLTGLAQQLESAGILIGDAAELVAANNLTKFTNSFSIADKTVNQLAKENITTSVTFNDNHGVYIIKDANSKIRKPIDFKSVDLVDCVPTYLLINRFQKEQ